MRDSGRGAPDPDGLAACAARANDLMALSRERIAQELLKLLAVDDPAPTVALMIGHGILTPVLPEIERDGVARLGRLVARETPLGAGDALRRLAALLPPDPVLAEAVAARLKLSNAQRKRLACAADPAEPGDVRPLAFAIGSRARATGCCCVHRTSIWRAGSRRCAAGIRRACRSAGGDLVARGLATGPIVAATLKAIERRWVDEGFPDAGRVRTIAAEEVDQALRSRK